MARRVVWYAAGLVTLVVAAAVAVYLTRPEDPPAAVPVPPASPAVVSPPVAPPAVVPSPPSGGAAGLVRYDFDGGLTPTVFDRAGRLPLRSSLAAGGALTTERHGTGLAVRFPAVCAVYGDDSCPRAILE